MIEPRELTRPIVDEAKGLGPPKRPTDLQDLSFKPQPMVQWLHPRVLLGAAREVALSSLFARFADKRELQGGLPSRYWDASGLAEGGSLWLDYASDTGDGFDPTYAIAYMLGRNHLSEAGNLSEAGKLRRGQILVLGGDQVYPSAEWKAYQDRFVGPYTAALPYVDGTERPPYLFALPGNHDWYDGLTSFMRLFCQRDWIGGWKTEQTRSYFAIRLPEPWWLWAVDTQFDTYIDAPQLSYFRKLAADHLRKGSKLILVTAKPSWVGVRDECETPQAWGTLAMLEQLASQRGATLELTLTGDLHHYCRYQGTATEEGRHKVTAGGAGACLSATHPLPEELHLPDQRDLSRADGGSCHTWRQVCTYPPPEESEDIAGELKGGRTGLGTPSFATLTAGLYGIVAMATALTWETRGLGFLAPLLLVAGIGWGLVALAGDGSCEGESAGRKRQRLVYGLGHGALHLTPTIAVAVLIGVFVPVAGAGSLALALVAGGLLGFLAGPLSFVFYLRRAQKADKRWHASETFAAQSRTAGRGYKHFLRLRIDTGGKVTVHAIGLRRVPSEWRIATGSNDPWVEPAETLDMELFDRFEAG